MKFVALISGGKDSCFNMMQCVAEGHELVALANLQPKDKDELDSYMYQTVGHECIDLYAEAMNLPLYRRTIQGSSVEIGKEYLPNGQDEVEDLFELLKQIKDELNIEAVSCGAILSNYQRVRVESVCARLGLTSLAYLWRRDQEELFGEMIACQVNAVLIKVAAMGLRPDKHLGLSLKEIQPHMLAMKSRFGLNVCGEGGEYETVTLDCPLFNKKIVIDTQQVIADSGSDFAAVGYLKVEEMHLEDKEIDTSKSLLDRVKHLPMKRSTDLFRDLFSASVCQPPPHALDRSFSVDHHIKADFEHRLESFAPPVLAQVTSEKLWVSGVHAVVRDGGSIREATQAAMESLKDLVIKHNFSMSELVVVHIYVRSMQEFADINAVYATYFSINPPARVCVQVDLPGDVALQIDCYLRRNNDTCCRETMHVQGLSHWAPANIGPYSQAVKTNETIFIAGQIPLCPASMKVVIGGIIPQARLSIRHVHNVLDAMSPQSTLQDIVLVVCYVTDTAFIHLAQEEWEKMFYTDENKHGMCHQQSCHKGIMECVVVPALPRGALIEWQTVCFTPRKSFNKTHSKQVTDTYKIDKVVCLVKNGQHFDLVFKVSLGILDTENYSSRLEIMVEETLDQVVSILDDPATYSFITYLTVYYNQKLVQISKLHEAVKAYFQVHNLDMPSIAFVPVLGFSSYRQLLSIVH